VPALTPYPADLEEQWQTRRGVTVQIRPIRPSDADIEQQFARSLSAEARYSRFLGVMNELSPQLLKRFTDIDYGRDMALIAVHSEQARETQIGVARYVTNDDGRSCEFAVVIADDWRRHGLAQKLIQKLMDRARDTGLEVFTGEVFADNHAMLELMRHMGFGIEFDRDDARLRRVSRRLLAAS
jgi:acetyltransferase